MMYASDPHESDSETEEQSEDEREHLEELQQGKEEGDHNDSGDSTQSMERSLALFSFWTNRGGQQQEEDNTLVPTNARIEREHLEELQQGKEEGGHNDSDSTLSIERSLELFAFRVSLYSDPMVQEAADRLRRSDRENKREAQANQHVETNSPTTFMGVVKSLQDKYEQVVRQYKYNVGDDSESARYGYRFRASGGPSAGTEHVPNSRASEKTSARKTITSEQPNRWLVWLGPVITLLAMVVIMSAREDVQEGSTLRSHSAVNGSNLESELDMLIANLHQFKDVPLEEEHAGNQPWKSHNGDGSDEDEAPTAAPAYDDSASSAEMHDPLRQGGDRVRIWSPIYDKEKGTYDDDTSEDG